MISRNFKDAAPKLRQNTGKRRISKIKKSSRICAERAFGRKMLVDDLSTHIIEKNIQSVAGIRLFQNAVLNLTKTQLSIG